MIPAPCGETNNIPGPPKSKPAVHVYYSNASSCVVQYPHKKIDKILTNRNLVSTGNIIIVSHTSPAWDRRENTLKTLLKASNELLDYFSCFLLPWNNLTIQNHPRRRGRVWLTPPITSRRATALSWRSGRPSIPIKDSMVSLPQNLKRRTVYENTQAASTHRQNNFPSPHSQRDQFNNGCCCQVSTS